MNNISNWCSIVGLLVSIIGLAITLVTMRTAKDIQRRIFQKERLPELLTTVKGHLSNLNQLLIGKSIDDLELKSELHRLNATNNNIYIKKRFSYSFKLKIRLFLAIKSPFYTKKLSESCYSHAAGLAAEMSESEKDLKKEI